MSSTDVVKSLYEAFGQGDMPTVLDLLNLPSKSRVSRECESSWPLWKMVTGDRGRFQPWLLFTGLHGETQSIFRFSESCEFDLNCPGVALAFAYA